MRKAIWLILTFLFSVGLGTLFYAGFYHIIGSDFNAFSLYKFRWESSGQIVIVKIDNASLDALTKSDLKVLTFSKELFLNLIERLEKWGAKSIGFDIVFANSDPIEKTFSLALQKYGNITIAAKLWVASEDAERVLPREVYPNTLWGMIDVLFDKNIVTKIKPSFSFGGKEIEHFSIAIYRRFLGIDKMSFGENDKTYEISPTRIVPLDEEGNAYIPFFKKPGTYESVSLKDVLDGKYPNDYFRDKIVLVGESGTLIHDSHFSPIAFGVAMPGIEFHANMIDAILQGKFLVPIGKNFLYVMAFIFAVISFFCIVRLPLWANVVYLTTPVLILCVGWFLLVEKGELIDYFLFLTVGFAFPMIGGMIYRYFVIDAKRRFLKTAFSRYISPEIVSEIATSSESLVLGGEKREITIFFSDIKGFTTISESLGTDKLFTLMEEYLSEMTNILIKNKWTLDKYIGDAVMGFYGAPIPIKRPEYLACKTALEQQTRLVELSQKWVSQGLPLIEARIGINTWEAMVGNIGSKNRFNYTAIGDSVNLASRLEWVNKNYGTHICVSETTYEKVKDDFIFRFLDRILVKGKTEWVGIYELLGFSYDTEIDAVAIWTYEKALSFYFENDFVRAKNLFAILKHDSAAQAMILRMEELQAWRWELLNGAYVMHEK